MPQLVGVSHHIDCCDLSVLDFKRGRLKFTIGLQRDETGQSVEETGTNKFRAILPEMIRQRLMDLHDGIEAENRPHGAASVPMVESWLRPTTKGPTRCRASPHSMQGSAAEKPPLRTR